MEQSSNERLRVLIEDFIKTKRVKSQNDFAQKVNKQRSYISEIVNEIRPLTKKFTAQIAAIFPDLNPDWLLTGEGNMLRSEDSQSRRTEAVSAPGPKEVPYYDVDFAAGFPEMENDQTQVPSGLVRLPQFDGADCLVNVTGGSMSPLISSGDAVALRRVSGPDAILYGEVYAIVTDEYRTIKRVRRSDVPGRIRLVPENPDYDPQDIDVAGIRHIYRVLGSVKLF